MNSAINWISLLVLWIGSCCYFYWIGWLHGNTAANLKSARHFDAIDLTGQNGSMS